MNILAEAVRKALRLRSGIVRQKNNQFTAVVLKLLKGESVYRNHLLEIIGEGKEPDRFLFICFHLSEDPDSIPTDYICDKLCKLFRGLAVFRYEEYLVGVQDFSHGLSGEQFQALLKKAVCDFDLHVGLSSRFSDLQDVRFHFLQAKSALETGTSMYTDNQIFHIQEQALNYLLLNSSGIFPAEYIYPKSLLKLRAYNKNSSVDYWDTLGCYLDNQMNIAETSRQLKVHRNTLLQRNSRLEDIFGPDLKNPDFRLWLRISMHLFDLEAGGNLALLKSTEE